MVRAILGLVDPELRRKIVIDYSPVNCANYHRLYIHFFTIIFEQYTYKVLRSCASPEKPTHIASWCSMLGSRPLYIPVPQDSWAGFRPDENGWSPPDSHITVDSLMLALHGHSICVDTIIECLQLLEWNSDPLSSLADKAHLREIVRLVSLYISAV
jgi:hypothetical protein